MSDSKDIIGDIKQTMNDRMKNPFLLSFICSWLAWNWLLVYDIFHFDVTYTLHNKIDVISKYVSFHKWWCHLFLIPLFSSIGVAIVYLSGSALFTYTFNTYNTTIKAWINKKSLKGDIVPLEYFKKLEKKYDRLKINSNNYLTENLAHLDEIEKTQDLLNKKHNEYVKAISANQRLEEEVETAKISNQELTKEIEKIGVFRTRENDTVANFFMGDKTYQFKIAKDAPWVPDELTFAITVRISEVSDGSIMMFDIANSKNIFYLENLKVSGDGNCVSFELKDVLDKQFKIQFYMIRKGQESYRGYCMQNNNAEAYTTIKLTNSKLS